MTIRIITKTTPNKRQHPSTRGSSTATQERGVASAGCDFPYRSFPWEPCRSNMTAWLAPPPRPQGREVVRPACCDSAASWPPGACRPRRRLRSGAPVRLAIGYAGPGRLAGLRERIGYLITSERLRRPGATAGRSRRSPNGGNNPPTA